MRSKPRLSMAYTPGHCEVAPECNKLKCTYEEAPRTAAMSWSDTGDLLQPLLVCSHEGYLSSSDTPTRLE